MESQFKEPRFKVGDLVVVKGWKGYFRITSARPAWRWKPNTDSTVRGRGHWLCFDPKHPDCGKYEAGFYTLHKEFTHFGLPRRENYEWTRLEKELSDGTVFIKDLINIMEDNIHDLKQIIEKEQALCSLRNNSTKVGG